MPWKNIAELDKVFVFSSCLCLEDVFFFHQEPKLSSQVEQVLGEYSKSIQKGGKETGMCT